MGDGWWIRRRTEYYCTLVYPLSQESTAPITASLAFLEEQPKAGVNVKPPRLSCGRGSRVDPGEASRNPDNLARHLTSYPLFENVPP